jgi:integrase
MPALKMSAKGLEALTAKPHARRIDYFDAARSGLCLTIGPKVSSWYLFKRIDRKQTRVKLGEWPNMGLLAARSHADEADRTVAAGKHPKAEQARQRAALVEARQIDRSRIVSMAAAAWSKHHLRTVGKATAADYARALSEFVAAFGDRDVGTITRGEIKRFLDTVSERSGTAANRCAVVVRLLFGFAEDRFDLTANPAVTVKNPTKQTVRSRVLDRAEIRIVWRAAELAGYPWGHCLRLALCTGQRIGEVGGILRGEVDGDGFWVQTRNKTGKRIDVLMNEHAEQILSDCPDFGRGAPYFSASTCKDGNPRPLRADVWNHALARHIESRLGEAAADLGLPEIIQRWTCHDLRRTVRTGLTGWCRVSPDTAERVLNHSIGGLRAVYDHADYRHHVAEALHAWGAELERILKGQPAAVTQIGNRRRAA